MVSLSHQLRSPDAFILPQVSAECIFPDIQTPPILPQELCDAIIDEIGYLEPDPRYWYFDTRTLKQCALVCRAWTPRAQVPRRLAG